MRSWIEHYTVVKSVCIGFIMHVRATERCWPVDAYERKSLSLSLSVFLYLYNVSFMSSSLVPLSQSQACARAADRNVKAGTINLSPSHQSLSQTVTHSLSVFWWCLVQSKRSRRTTLQSALVCSWGYDAFVPLLTGFDECRYVCCCCRSKGSQLKRSNVPIYRPTMHSCIASEAQIRPRPVSPTPVKRGFHPTQRTRRTQESTYSKPNERKKKYAMNVADVVDGTAVLISNNYQARTQGGPGGYEDPPPIAKNIPKRSTVHTVCISKISKACCICIVWTFLYIWTNVQEPVETEHSTWPASTDKFWPNSCVYCLSCT